MLPPAAALLDRLDRAARLRLFLDYDGTLAGFAPTPDVVRPDAEVVSLLTRLVALPRLQPAVVSGRRLSHVQALLPVPGLLLAGTYGIEMRLPGGEVIERVAYDAVRPTLEQLKPAWARLIAGRQGFYLEDKGWALALHARFASEAESEAVLARAAGIARQAIEQAPAYLYRLLDGTRFLEIGPWLANKGRSVEYILDRYPWPGALPLFVGDDDKDEEAFAVVQDRGGVAIMVAEEWRPTHAEFQLENPRATRAWLEELLRHFQPHPPRA